MSSTQTIGLQESDKTDKSVSPALLRYFTGFRKALDQFSDLELARKRAFHIRMKTIENLDKNILDFESNFNKWVGKLSWATSAPAALEEIKTLASGSRVLYQPHRLSKELGIYSQDNKYVLLSPSDRAHWLSGDGLGTDEKISRLPVEIRDGDVGLLFPEFLVSENGSLVFAFDDPVIGKLLTQCRKLILVAGVEQLTPQMADLEVLLSLLSTYKYGIAHHPYYFIEHGHLQERNTPNHQDLHLILLDNGRSDILSCIPQRKALCCINCGACLNNSNNSGAAGPEFSSTAFPGVIGAVKAPFMSSFDEHIFRSFRHPLSGRATGFCPVNIDLKDLLQENRYEAVKRKTRGRIDSYAWTIWQKAMMSRKWMNQGAGMKNYTLKGFFRKSWGEQREFPKIKDKSFNQWWRENRPEVEI